MCQSTSHNKRCRTCYTKGALMCFGNRTSHRNLKRCTAEPSTLRHVKPHWLPDLNISLLALYNSSNHMTRPPCPLPGRDSSTEQSIQTCACKRTSDVQLFELSVRADYQLSIVTTSFDPLSLGTLSCQMSRAPSQEENNVSHQRRLRIQILEEEVLQCEEKLPRERWAPKNGE